MLNILVFVVVRDVQFRKGVAHNIQSCKNHVAPVAHSGQSNH
jgi:hypothetical protein